MEIRTVDAHVAGAAVRLIVAGAPTPSGGSLADRRDALIEAAGPVIAGLCREPRGHAGTVVVLLAEPDRAEADAGLLFVGGDGAIPLCGQGLIGAVGLALDRQLIVPRRADLVELDTIAGPVSAHRASAGAAGAVSVRYVGPPASVLRPNHAITIGRRELRTDLVWTGAELVAILDAEAAGAPLVISRLLELQRAGREAIARLDDVAGVSHPSIGPVPPVASVVFIGVSPEHGADVRSGVVHRGGEVDRSPGGGATVAVATVLSAMGVLAVGQTVVHQGLAGTSLRAQVTAVGELEGRPELTVEVEGVAWPTGEHLFVFSPEDPLVEGEAWS